MGGTMDGLEGDHVLLAPPYIIDETHVERDRRQARCRHQWRA
jgi:hypothetical protein